mmetsp:Transcript_6882/g.15247  ORF Transcript_6882/g.15247 Transcript_6882/m.15247 type:complete len:101 (-) Transcript_6882:145-447(-)
MIFRILPTPLKQSGPFFLIPVHRHCSLRCGSCKVVLTEMQLALAALKAKRPTIPPKEFEILEVLEETCDKQVSEYGLQLRSNKPTELFSKDKAITRWELL